MPLDGQWNVPTVRVPQVASHIGQVVVYPSSSLRVDVGALSGIRPERLTKPDGDVTDAQVAIASANPQPTADETPMAFAFWDEGFELPLRVIPRRRTLHASVATLVEIDRKGAVLRSSVSVESRHASVFSVQVQLRRDWEVTSADVPATLTPLRRRRRPTTS